LKILLPFVGDSIGGSHLSSIELYKSLVENGYEVLALLHNENGPLSKVFNENNIEYYELPTSFLAGESPKKIMIVFGIIKNIIPFVKFIKNNNIDVVHGNDLRINLTWSVAAKAAQVKYIWHQRTLLSNSYLWKFIPFLCSHFIAISQAVLESAPKNLNSKKTSLIYNPFDTSMKFNSLKCRQGIIKQCCINNNPIILGYVGRLVHYKNVDFLIKCLHDLIYIHHKNLHLLIVGTGSEDYVSHLKEIVNEIGLIDNVTFSGFSSNPLELISGIDILIASSTVDAFGRSIVEAMLQSTPVLVANKGGHLEIVIDGHTGIFYQANNQESFISKALGLIDSDSLRKSIANSALEVNIDKYSRERHFLLIEEIYNS
jgi:glycosyltransferase involved in cell wall biosynthesis